MQLALGLLVIAVNAVIYFRVWTRHKTSRT